MDLQQGLSVEGPAGTAEVRWGYHRAAALGPWSLVNDVLTAEILDGDPLRLQQAALTFVVLRPNGLPWTWPVLELQLAGRQLTARLGPKERVH
jgi:hypothetical protein